jgi:hypothetical protein
VINKKDGKEAWVGLIISIFGIGKQALRRIGEVTR